MIDASDLSIIIPFRADTPDRLENLETLLTVLEKTTRNSEVVLVESGSRAPSAEHLSARRGVSYWFERDRGPFHKTRLLNEGVARSARPFVASYDADTLLFPAAFDLALHELRRGAGIVFPFSGDLFELRRSARRAMIVSAHVDMLSPLALMNRRGKLGIRDLFQVVYLHDNHVGAAVLFDRAVYQRCGGYNENFISWGYEDNEIVERFSKLGVNVVRIAGYPALHLAHRRGTDSGRPNPYFRANVREYRRIRNSDPAQLRDLIARGALRRPQRPPIQFSGHLEGLFWRMLAKAGIS